MNIIDASLYDLNTGEIVRIGSYNDDLINQELGNTLGFVRGLYDPANKKVDIATGKIVDFQPEKPSEDHEWDAQVKRWKLNENTVAAVLEAQEIKVEVVEQEQGSLRAIREVLLQLAEAIKLPESDALKTLKNVDSAIEAVRPKLQTRG